MEGMDRYQKHYPLDKFVSHCYPVDKAEEAVRFSMTDDCMKVVIASTEYLK